ncbi:winged helix DNA-binding domain-containing protein [Kitasatospora sp. NBC_00240]|uniref:winged helix DNA-binding domain-containing protein n=1 Tax=Kitasatospora sp. NBC_00240 TaxID=2903567 RepID=UPI00224DE660|nr:winged helix DNA-binding domain-containing protein [Kitasatospora sp. NBC_00240]MCX5209688.1 winged helix DNA-binding domain-containing protein [Kitasatospora sp. NBC_00240]
MTTDETRLLRWRMHAQFGFGRTGPDPVSSADPESPGGPGQPDGAAGLAARAAGIQAQDAAAARLGLRARGLGSAADVEAAYRAGEVVAGWLMRGTLHLVPAVDLPWLLRLFGARNLAAGAGRRRQLGLTDEICERAVALLPEVLAAPLSRADLIAALIERGVEVNPAGQAPAHLMGYAAARGLLCRGAEVAPREPGYVLRPGLPAAPPASAAPPGPPGDADLAALAVRYLAAFGPAGAADLAAWSGLPVTVCRRAVAAAGFPEVAPGLFADPGAEPTEAGAEGGPEVRLLGAYDNYLLGYRDRTAMLDPAFAKRINAGGGVIHPALVADGRVLGRWRTERARGATTLLVEPFGPLSGPVREGLRAEAEGVGRFLDVPTELRIAHP